MLWLLIIACAQSAPPPVAEPEPEFEPELEPVSEPKPRSPVWKADIAPLSAETRAAMTGVSWRDGCPVHLDDLRQITMTHHTFDGRVVEGELIVAASVAKTVQAAFKAAFDAGYPIKSMRPVRYFGGDDDKSMDENNTSAFNCRNVAGGSSWSQHSYGSAIDINPVENPYINRAGRVSPSAGEAYVDRARTDTPSLLTAESVLVVSLKAAGWGWGGEWSSLKDYQHFSASGR